MQTFHFTSLALSGALGIVVTLSLENNFPYDGDWTYLLALVGAAIAQLLFFALLGRVMPKEEPEATHKLAWLAISATVLLALAFVIHIVILGAKHS